MTVHNEVAGDQRRAKRFHTYCSHIPLRLILKHVFKLENHVSRSNREWVIHGMSGNGGRENGGPGRTRYEHRRAAGDLAKADGRSVELLMEIVLKKG